MKVGAALTMEGFSKKPHRVVVADSWGPHPRRSAGGTDIDLLCGRRRQTVLGGWRRVDEYYRYRAELSQYKLTRRSAEQLKRESNYSHYARRLRPYSSLTLVLAICLLDIGCQSVNRVQQPQTNLASARARVYLIRRTIHAEERQAQRGTAAVEREVLSQHAGELVNGPHPHKKDRRWG